MAYIPAAGVGRGVAAKKIMNVQQQNIKIHIMNIEYDNPQDRINT